jgi:molybdenum cofactor guanylyltransferase
LAEKIPSCSVPRENITAVILAGGAGRRAGNRDKGTIVWRGLPLIAHVRNRLAPQLGSIVISCNRNAKFYADYSETTFPDLRSDYQGPLAGLEAASGQVDTDFVLIAPCDTPLLPDNLVQRLLNALLADNVDGCYVRANGQKHYLCVLLRSHCLESVSSYLDGGGRAVRRWLAEHNITAVDFDSDDDAFLNINNPDAVIADHSSPD